MLFGRNTFVKFAFIVSGALAQLQPGSNYQISAQTSTQSPRSGNGDNQGLNICANLADGSVTIKSGGCDPPTWGTWTINGSPGSQNGYAIRPAVTSRSCGRFTCFGLNAESESGSTVHLDRKPSCFNITHDTGDMYKVVLAGSYPSLYWTIHPGGNSIVLQEAMEDGNLQTFKFAGGQ